MGSEGDQPTLLADFAPERVNAHREQMLREGFATGHLSAPDRQPLVWDYSHAFLTDSGGRLLGLSTHTAAWERAKEAYDIMEQSWFIRDLSDYMEALVHENRNA